ncbi:hypothetical protein CDO73_10775 [Saccharibacillus sp. O23]|uniref:polyprenyl synthetase family protein n=1 Tax=Saccharibacillus sp. O23 TaxID=2009338 RepID=UPI000B4DF1F8|nr:polyprenyl synthetase family protein [Saccharibacillus sp. O23]OWR30397.1 hypothetical protein CDO73_10775 [Saccharibacillus sp. O23]
MESLTENFLFNTIMNHSKDSFLTTFDENWKRTLSQFDQKFASSHQMRAGHRLRPILVAWGHSINFKSGQLDFSKVLPVAISVELLHKASILIDDLIDGDIARHSLPTFHIEHTDNEAILLALQMISASFKNLGNNLEQNENVNLIKCLSDTLFNMAEGVLKELDSSSKNLFNLGDVNEIINLQTVGLIRNSFFLGYSKGDVFDIKTSENVESIGNYLGYVFQLLNDLEPFSHTSKSLEYKGNLNFDFNKSRKNLAISYLLSLSSGREQKKIINERNYQFILELYQKYQVQEICLQEVSRIKKEICIKIENINAGNTKWSSQFHKFIDYIFDFCIQRL